MEIHVVIAPFTTSTFRYNEAELQLLEGNKLSLLTRSPYPSGTLLFTRIDSTAAATAEHCPDCIRTVGILEVRKCRRMAAENRKAGYAMEVRYLD